MPFLWTFFYPSDAETCTGFTSRQPRFALVGWNTETFVKFNSSNGFNYVNGAERNSAFSKGPGRTHPENLGTVTVTQTVTLQVLDYKRTTTV
jgi:hypothetical protein